MNHFKLSLFFIPLFFISTARAQFKSPLSIGFRNDIQKVIEDYPKGFASIKGAPVQQNPQTVEYASKLIPVGATTSSITQYSASGKNIYSFQATMLATEEFAAAEKKYKWLYQQLKGMNVTYIVDQYTLQGHYEAPQETKSFATSELTLAHPPTPLRKLRVDVSMQFDFPEWKVGLVIYEKEKEDAEQGTQTDQ